MQDVPKIVRERLRAAALRDNQSLIDSALLDHPDADALAAFAERSLAQSERNAVMVHLSRCADCRDIVALALPDAEAMQPGLVSVSSRGGWLTWPALRWGFIAVGVVTIASVGILQYRRGHSDAAAQMQTLQRTSPATDSSKKAASSPAPVVRESGKTEKAAPSTVTDAKALTVPSQAAKSAAKRFDIESALQSSTASPSVAQSSASSSRSGMNVATALQRGQIHAGPHQQQGLQPQQLPIPGSRAASSVAVGTATPAIIPPASQTVMVAAPPVTDAQSQNGNLTLAQNQPTGQTVQDEAKTISRSKPAETVEVASAAPMAQPVEGTVSEKELPAANGDAVNGRNFTQLIALTPASRVYWSISTKGILRRSDDQGRTWKDVNQFAGPAQAANFAGYEANAVTSVAQSQATTKKQEGARQQPTSLPVFRTVTIAGSDVWAGGSNAALYHSTDGGDHWMQVVPASSGVALTGDVLALEFSDSQHGKVTTSTPEIWITSDAGQTWQKQ